MSVYTSISVAELTQLLKHYECGELVSYQGINEGISNTNYYLTTTLGEFILTIYENTDVDTLVNILSLQEHLKSEGISCAKVQPTISGELLDSIENKPLSIQDKLSGTTQYSVTSKLCQQIGLTLAQLHVNTAEFKFPVKNSRGSAWILKTSEKLMDHISTQDQLILQQELKYLSGFSRLSLPAGAIHADLFPDNVLVLDDLITGIIDFALACHEVYLFDLCIAINAWCSQTDGQLDRYLMRDMLSAYSSLRPLTQDENIAIPMMLRATALRFWLSRLHDVVFPGAGELTFNKDPQEFKAILLARRERLSGMQR